MVAENGDLARAQALHEAQRRERLRPAVDEVADEPQDVAAKYKGDASAVAKLTQKVKAGGAGVWGPVPMPPNAQVPDDDIKALVTWILALKK